MVGSTRDRRYLADIRELGWGRVFCGKPSPYPGEPWALDNGAFAAWSNGKPFNAEKFAKKAHEYAPLRPIFGVLPDMVGRGAESLALSLSWLPRLPASVPWYLAVQEGMTEEMVRPSLDRVAGLFLGGASIHFKRTASAWSALAHRHGKRFHYARASTANHVRYAYDVGADSCDTTQALWSLEHWAKFKATVRGLGQPSMSMPLFGGAL